MGRAAVVLGGGAGGLAAAERLRATLPADVRVVLIDRSFTPSLGLSTMRVLRGRRAPAELAATVRPAALPGVELVTAEVTGIDVDGRQVQLAAAAPVDYDALIVALGAELDTAALPGLDAALTSGVAGQFYTPDGAVALHRRIEALQSGRVVVLIGPPPFKCPPAPYEAAFLIADQLGTRFTGGAARVDVITAEPRPIPVVGTQVGDAVVSTLNATGIGFTPGKVATAIDPNARTITFADGDVEPFDLLAVVPPHRSPVAALLPALVNPGGWIPVDPQTMATATPGVWAVGDNAAVPLANGMALPKAAIFAERAAAVAADQLARYLGAGAPDTRYRGDGYCVMVVGENMAAKVAGEFLAAPAPQVLLRGPNRDFYDEKLQLERDWLARWGT
ncbi:NAD(P)/FAD-dependent oxidoreductase [[Mycobacterium] crassicus]|uniref:FAD-dependent oxidoreductase n=1 Tax=[Mycobacterium] crassicus TaxID=2872309 RepID=A0ABU5XEL6_9MYCO|nr:FAD-dependent oxidoreductase [Mycolicibacter sp. MYC098]MEB3020750.1 FAD-dependent oxidoreductase [Mycolicibacter sp. MYC098]